MKNVFVALDQMSLKECLEFVDSRKDNLSLIKVGLEFFLRNGREGIEQLSQHFDGKIFLDLKLHDIPKTVERSIISLENLPVHFLTIHLGGGERMVKDALSQCHKSLPSCQILGVTYLTSLSPMDLKNIYLIESASMAMKAMFENACLWKLPGIVLSSQDLDIFKEVAAKHDHRPICVTPGIRFETLENDDQQRALSPPEALDKGSDYLVIGRPLTKVDLKTFEKRSTFLRNLV